MTTVASGPRVGAKFAELFAGAGGLSMGLERAGWACAWHAENADAPRAILAHRWPDVPLYGDVLALDGAALTARHGPIDLLTGGSPCQDLSVAGKRAGLGGARSSLFFQQMRLWDETGADLCLWENVDGARSSNRGADFGEVLRAFVGAPIVVPSDGWRSAGVAAGPTGVAAWRVLDSQYLGVPQRRRRVFVLGTRAGRVDPAEVLSLAESVRGDSSSRRETREGSAANAEERIAGTLTGNGDQHSGFRDGDDTVAVPITFVLGSDPISRVGGAAQPVTGRNGDPGCVVVPLQEIGKRTGKSTNFSQHGSGIGVDGDPMYTLQAGAQHGIVAYSLGSHAGLPGSDGAMSGHVQAPQGIPRRLTPRECERLMSWPDDWTLVPDAKGKPLSDAARYKACGNGVASVHTHWIGERLALALKAPA